MDATRMISSGHLCVQHVLTDSLIGSTLVSSPGPIYANGVKCSWRCAHCSNDLSLAQRSTAVTSFRRCSRRCNVAGLAPGELSILATMSTPELSDPRPMISPAEVARELAQRLPGRANRHSAAFQEPQRAPSAARKTSSWRDAGGRNCSNRADHSSRDRQGVRTSNAHTSGVCAASRRLRIRAANRSPREPRLSSPSQRAEPVFHPARNGSICHLRSSPHAGLRHSDARAYAIVAARPNHRTIMPCIMPA